MGAIVQPLFEKDQEPFVACIGEPELEAEIPNAPPVPTLPWETEVVESDPLPVPETSREAGVAILLDATPVPTSPMEAGVVETLGISLVPEIL